MEVTEMKNLNDYALKTTNRIIHGIYADSNPKELIGFHIVDKNENFMRSWSMYPIKEDGKSTGRWLVARKSRIVKKQIIPEGPVFDSLDEAMNFVLLGEELSLIK